MDLLSRAARALPILLVALGPIACAHGGERSAAGAVAGEPTDDPRAEGTTASAPEPEPRTISTDRANATDPGAGSPTREASQRIVEEGKGYLIADRPAEAASRFERAARIDPTNGFAYYHLGRARIALGDRAGAIGVLEKAESLLGPYPEWRERATRLLERLGAR